MLMRSQWR